ncbi:MAG TPA: hypothetical protein VF297_23855 [Pyrinomonadaceae bacterium]
MSEDERGAFEAAFVADESLFEQARAVEDELVEAYVRGTLASHEREKFERSFLTNARRRGRVEFTRSMLGRIAEHRGEAVAANNTVAPAAAHPSGWDSIVSLFKTPRLAYGAAFTLLALIVGGWLLLRNPNRPEVTRQVTPTPTAQPIRSNGNETSPADANTNSHVGTPYNTNASPNPKPETPDNNQNPKTPKRRANATAPVLALFTGAVRGEGKTPELNLPQGASGASLRLHLESTDYNLYRAEVVDPDGTRVFRSGNLKAKNSLINLYVPARSLGRGDYLIKLSGLNPQNETESVADYALRVNRK